MSNPNIAKDSPTTFKPGQSGNPNGRPKQPWTWSGVLRAALEQSPDGDPRQYKELVAESLRLKALEGDVAAIKEFGNRIEGLPKQVVEQYTEMHLYENMDDAKLDEAIRQKSKEVGTSESASGEEKADRE